MALNKWTGLAAVLAPLIAGAQIREGEPVLLEPSVVVAGQPLVKTVGDTVVFHPDALVLEDDAMLEDILQKIPGIEVEGGHVMLYGRKVEKLLVGGRLYFGGDILTGLRNIQGDAVESIRAYERPSDFTRLSGVDDGEAEPVLDVRIRRKFMGAWKGRVQGGGSYPLRYLSSGNAGMISDTAHVGIVANFRNTPFAPTLSTTRLTRFGNGADGDRDRRETGIDYSRDGKKLDVDAHVKYTGADYRQDRSGWTQTIYPANSTYALSRTGLLGRNDALRAESDIEWRPSKSWTFLFKPYLNYNGTASWSDPETETFAEDPRLDPGRQALNTVRQQSVTFQQRYEGKIVAQATRRFAGKGRTATVRLSESLSGGKYFHFNDYIAVTHKNGKEVVRKQYIESPWMRSDATLQASWNEPVGKGFHLNFLASLRVIHHGIDRDFHSLEAAEGMEEWHVPPSLRLREQMAFLPGNFADYYNPELSSEGTYTGILLTATASMRYVRKKFNTVAGVSVKPIRSIVRYSTTALPDRRITSGQFYASPNFSLRYNKSRTEYLSLVYRSYVSTPSPTSLIPIRSGTNPLIVRVGNPDLKPSFTHRINLTYNYSAPAKGNSLVLEAEGRVVQNAFATSTEFVPQTGGRNVRTCNIDGNWSAKGSAVFHHSFRGTPLSLSNHLDADYTNDAAWLYNTVSKADERSVMRRLSARERLDVTAQWRKIAVTARAGAEYTYERSLLHPEMKQMPFALYAGVDAGWNLPRRWRIASDFGFYASRGHGFSELDRNLYLWNASVSKGFFKGKATVRLTANDLLNQRTHLTYSFGASNRRVFVYDGFGRIVLLQFIWRFSGRSK